MVDMSGKIAECHMASAIDNLVTPCMVRDHQD